MIIFLLATPVTFVFVYASIGRPGRAELAIRKVTVYFLSQHLQLLIGGDENGSHSVFDNLKCRLFFVGFLRVFSATPTRFRTVVTAAGRDSSYGIMYSNSMYVGAHL